MLVIHRTIVQLSANEYDKMLCEQVGVCTSCGRTHSNVPMGVENMLCAYCHEKAVYSVNVLRKANKIEIL